MLDLLELEPAPQAAPLADRLHHFALALLAEADASLRGGVSEVRLSRESALYVQGCGDAFGIRIEIEGEVRRLI